MPMLTTLRMRLPVWPFQSPLRTASAERRHAVEHLVHLGHDVDAVDDDARAPRRAQRDVQHGALLGDVDLRRRGTSPSMRSRRPHSSASSSSSRSVSSVTRCFE